MTIRDLLCSKVINLNEALDVRIKNKLQVIFATGCVILVVIWFQFLCLGNPGENMIKVTSFYWLSLSCLYRIENIKLVQSLYGCLRAFFFLLWLMSNQSVVPLLFCCWCFCFVFVWCFCFVFVCLLFFFFFFFFFRERGCCCFCLFFFGGRGGGERHYDWSLLDYLF